MKKYIAILTAILLICAVFFVYNRLTNKKLENEIMKVIEMPILPKKLDYEKDKTIGTILIPKIKLKLPIIVGAYEPNLGKGAAWLENTGRFGSTGNAALASHKSYDGKLFNRIYQLEKGDLIRVKLKNDESYRYVITRKKVVKPTQISVLDQPPDEEIITLITCTTVYDDADRLIIVAKRANEDGKDDNPQEK